MLGSRFVSLFRPLAVVMLGILCQRVISIAVPDLFVVCMASCVCMLSKATVATWNLLMYCMHCAFDRNVCSDYHILGGVFSFVKLHSHTLHITHSTLHS